MQLALGTVQFGLGYGIAGRDAPVDEAEVRRILAHAHAWGIRRLDTAPAYGDIEERLPALCEGRDFEIVSKIAAMPTGLDADEASAFVRTSIERSRARLGAALRGLIFHSEADVQGVRGLAAWRAAVEETAAAGLAVGVSRYAPACLNLPGPAPSMYQVPGNALDQRVAAWTPAEPKPEVTLRSAFLQGLLLLDPEEGARRLPAAGPALRRWADWSAARDLPRLIAALSVVKGFAPISFCLVGVDGLQQLAEICEAWQNAEPIAAPELTCEEAAVIDPRSWRK